jgi:16S rRNA (uracil1498-N3)-methyltransferase
MGLVPSAFGAWREGLLLVSDRFYCPEPPRGGRVRLVADEAHHLARVRRLGPGDKVEVFDGLGHTYPAEVVAVERGRVDLQVLGDPVTEPPPLCALTLATALPKGERLDWLVEKATELGVARLQPLFTERSVVEPRAGKIERLRRIVVEASKQCGRSRLMELEPPIAWTEYLVAEHSPARMLAHPGCLPAAAWTGVVPGQRAAIAIGPEGGFTEPEVRAGRQAGWQAISLGRTILRIETAALVACALILQRAESLE